MCVYVCIKIVSGDLGDLMIVQVEFVFFLYGAELDVKLVFGLSVAQFDGAVSCRFCDFEVFEVDLLSDVSVFLFVE